MKVIGTGPDGNYICEVTHTELEKLTDKYYGKLDKLKIGDAMDLGAGYNFRDDIKRACSGMTEAMENFERGKNTLHRFAVMVASVPAPTPVVDAIATQQRKEPEA